MGEVRLKKVESLLREKIGEMLVMNELKDPRIDHLVTISSTVMARDLKTAKVYVSYIGDAEKHDDIVRVLNNAAGFIQSYIAKQIRLRHTPRLTFFADRSIEKGFEITKKINELFP